MKANLKNIQKQYATIPTNLNAGIYYVPTEVEAYADGWRDVITPEYNAETQKLSDWQVIDDTITKEVIDLTAEELQAIEDAKVVEYRAKIFNTFESLLKSAKERAVGKVGENLTERQLDDLELSYNKKNEDALKIIVGEPVEQVVLDTLNFEIEFDFNNQFTLIEYCGLINNIHTQGNIAFNKFKALAENFRSRLLTDLKNKDFGCIDKRFAVVGQITAGMSMEDLENLNTIFNETT